ncbi:H-2 class II histocompatibility antigen, A-Q alpha chain-like [Echeneis naucrates]|uniref:H-2 class II histocompatibility antigen, A-Q alpha chain-like n=1 Tax=Echeneis naucrates TaxID=173247 RepID=A0A665UH58_ECHNA|nr:H-2 class II histocompatibility antigen, A-Q alpha chain-like [Echeneis naucrates]
MKCSTIIILILNTFCVFSEIAHEVVRIVGCLENGTTEVQFTYDAAEFLYVDFERHEVVYSVPPFFQLDPSEMVDGLHVYKDALKGKKLCSGLVAFFKVEEKNPAEVSDAPESVIYPADEVQEGVENTLICFVYDFYPPFIEVSWTKNGHPVSEGVTLSRYYPNSDQTFYQLSTLTFTPREGDIYSCTVEHMSLDKPKTKFWEPEFNHQSLGPDIFGGVGLTMGFVGIAAGTYLIAKGRYSKIVDNCDTN